MENVYFFTLLTIAILAILASVVYATIMKIRPNGDYELPIGTILIVIAFFFVPGTILFLPENTIIDVRAIFWGIMWLILSICSIFQITELQSIVSRDKYKKQYWLYMVTVVCYLTSIVMFEFISLKVL